MSNHEVAEGRIRPMVMIHILGGGGIGMMTISGIIHDSLVRGRGGKTGGQSFGR